MSRLSWVPGDTLPGMATNTWTARDARLGEIEVAIDGTGDAVATVLVRTPRGTVREEMLREMFAVDAKRRVAGAIATPEVIGALVAYLDDTYPDRVVGDTEEITRA